MQRILLIALIALLTGPSAAQDDDSARVFNDAWRAYIQARDSGDEKNTLDAARVVLDVANEVLPEDDERMPLLLSNYGEALRATGRIDESREVLERAVALTRRINGRNSIKNVVVLMSYADAVAGVRDPRQQKKYYREALKIIAATLGSDSVEFAAASYRAGVKLLELSRSHDGKHHLRDAYDIFTAKLGPDSQEAGLAALYLGKIELARNRFRDASEQLVLALPGLAGDYDNLSTAYMYLVQAYELDGRSGEATQQLLALGEVSAHALQQNLQPLFRIAPKFPSDMLAARRSGWVDIELTVDERGFVLDPIVIDRDGGESFEQAAIDAVLRFRYAPRFENGEAVAVDGVKTRITFDIE